MVDHMVSTIFLANIRYIDKYFINEYYLLLVYTEINLVGDLLVVSMRACELAVLSVKLSWLY